MVSLTKKQFEGNNSNSNIRESEKTLTNSLIQLSTGTSKHLKFTSNKIIQRLVFIIKQLQLTFYIFHPTVKKKQSKRKLVFHWSNRGVTIPITKFLSLIQFTYAIQSQSEVTDSQILLKINQNLRPGILKITIIVLTSLLLLYNAAFMYALLRKSKFNNQNKKNSLINFLAFLRFFVSDLFFLPIFQLMIFSVSCTREGDSTGYYSSLGKELSCVLSSSDTLTYLGFIALIFHVYAAMLIIYFQTNFTGSSKLGLVLVYSVGFVTIFISRRGMRSIIDESQRRFVLTITAFNVWFSLIFAVQVSCNSIYQTSIVIFLISFISLIITLAVKSEDPDLEYLDKKPSEMKLSWKIQLYLEKICLILRKSMDGNERNKILLNGVIENIQNQLENESNSPLNFNNIYSRGLSYSQFDSIEKKALLEYLSVRFQNDEHLNISLVCFLTDFMKKRNLAYEHIYNLEKSQNLSSISLYKIQLIKDFLNETEEDNYQKGNSSPSRKKLKVPKYIRERMMLEFSKMLEQSTTEFIYLWQTILDENPPIKKVFSGIKDSQKSIQSVLDYWESNANVFHRRPEAKLVMGKFLKDVIDQAKEGEHMINESFTLIKKKHEEKFKIQNLNYLSDIENLQLPCFIVGFPSYGKKFKFVSCNSIFSLSMGCTKSEIMEKNLEDLMPVEDELARNYITEMFKKVEKSPKKFTSGKIFPFLKKNGFLTVSVCDLKFNVDNDKQKYLTIVCHQDKFIKPKAQILIDNKGNILAHNSSVTSVFNTKNMILSKMKIENIENLINIKMKDLKKLISKKNLYVTSLLKEEHLQKEDIQNNLTLEMIKITLMGKKVFLANISNSTSSSEKNSETNSKNSKKMRYKSVKNKGFYYKLDGNPNLAYYGGFDKKFAFENSNINFTQMPVEDLSSMDKYCKMLYEIKNPKKFKNSQGEFKDKIDYSEGIRVKRLMQNGNIIDWYQGIDDDDSEFEFEEEKEKTSKKGKEIGKLRFGMKKSQVIKRKKRNYDEEDDLDDDFRILDNMNNKSKIFMMLKNMKMTGSLKCLIALVSIFYLVLAGFNTMITLSRSTLSNDLKGFANIDYASTFRNSDMSGMMNLIFDICLRNEGTNFEYGIEGDSKTVEEKNLQDLEMLREYLQGYEEKNSVILQTIDTLSLSAEFSNYYNTKNVTIYKGGIGQKFSVAEGVRQVITSYVTLLQSDPSKIKFDQPDVIFVRNNTLGDLLLSMIGFVNLNDQIKPMALIRQESTENTTRNFLISISIGSITLFYLVFYFYYAHIESFVDTFYGFNVNMIEKIVSRSERYIQFLQMRQIEGENNVELNDNSDDEMRENVKQGNKNEINFEEIMSQLRRRKKKGTLKPKIGFERIIIFVILVASFGWLYKLYYVQDEIIKSSVQILDSFERIALTETILWAGLNSLQLSMFDVGGKYMSQPNVVRMRSFTDRAFAQNDITLKAASMNYKKTEQFNKYYTMIYNRDSCVAYKDLEPEKYNEEECYSLFNGLMKMGFSKVSIAYIDQIQKYNDYVDYFMHYKEKSEWNFKDEKCQEYPSMPNWKNYLMCLMATKEYKNIELMTRKYVKVFFRKISSVANNFVINSLETFYVDALQQMILFNILMFFVCCLGIWLVFEVGKSDIRNMGILKFLPLESIKANKKMRRFLQGKIDNVVYYED